VTKDAATAEFATADAATADAATADAVAPLRVAFLGPFGLHPKGTMQARALPAARALAAAGHAVTVIMPPWHTPEETARVWTAGDVQLEYVDLAGLGVPGVGHARVAARMLRAAEAFEPDVIHAFKPKAYSGLTATLFRARQRLGARGLLVVDTDDWEGPGGWNEIEPYSWRQRAFFAWQERWGLTHTDAVTAASRALQTLAWSMGVRRDRVLYLPNALPPGAVAVVAHPVRSAVPGEGVDPGSEAMTTPDADHADRPLLLLYTRFFEFNLDRPLEVLRRVRQALPGARLVIAGAGLHGEDAAIRRLTKERGLEGAVDMRGWVEPADAPALFAEADIGLYPFNDTLVNRTKSPVKLLEMMGAGLPIVAEAVGELGEVIEGGVSGVLVPSGDSEGMAEAVVRLWQEPLQRARIGEGARKRVAQHYAWSANAGRLADFYRANAQRRNGG
jgi:glycosyltransferase involved in cell wall biosynthesis